MAIIKGSESLIKGISGKIGGVVGTVDAENRTVLRSMPTSGRQGRQEGNIIPQQRMKIIGEYMNKNNYSLELYFEKSRPTSNGASEFSKRNVIKTGPFEEPEEPDYSKFFVAYGGYSAIPFQINEAMFAAGVITVSVAIGAVSPGTIAIPFLGIITPETKSITYYEAGQVDDTSANRDEEIQFATTINVTGRFAGFFFVDKVTRQPSVSEQVEIVV